jgi:hypothetical protein
LDPELAVRTPDPESDRPDPQGSPKGLQVKRKLAKPFHHKSGFEKIPRVKVMELIKEIIIRKKNGTHYNQLHAIKERAFVVHRR